MTHQLTNAEITSYQEDGYLILHGFFNEKEVSKLYHVAIEDDAISRHSIDLNDQSGKKTKLALWYTPGDDVYGLLTRSQRIALAVGYLMDGESPVCHYHSKLMQKEPKVGGAWEWHQDYGYWYKNEFLFPDQMISVMVAITEATKENGCLQVIKGSHKMGRVEHGSAGEQAGASQRYVDLALKTMELIYVELKPGDTLFFHANVLHRSEANLSDQSRWSLISAYNRQSNIPYNEKSASCLIPLSIVPDSALLSAGDAGLTEKADFLTHNDATQ
ncbi:MAG TPA: phytanoyl-CoA dioxygenase family protein [Pedobacter sp.]|uniref:phytanoyl-CoA dioxygenase family protein n=1 Tax=Pedobacter sp. TaxID=1411316 RepID=UPI002BB798D2|nr:phytanoyl-CoA dioxygenase family protein [Pedobacter sp.]HMI01400.1 phytanoyl-CoA dioxygenase family protein [Pedobacter sp.]